MSTFRFVLCIINTLAKSGLRAEAEGAFLGRGEATEKKVRNAV